MQDQLSLIPPTINQAPKLNLKSLTAKVAATTDQAAKQQVAKKAAEDFESSFLTTMLSQMWTGIEAEAPFGGGHAEKVYRSMMVNEYAKTISASGGIGIAEHVYRELLSAQEGRK